MDRLTWYQPGENLEDLLCQAGHVGIYDGDLKHVCSILHFHVYIRFAFLFLFKPCFFTLFTVVFLRVLYFNALLRRC